MNQITKTVNGKTISATLVSGTIPHWEVIIFCGSQSMTDPKWLNNADHAESLVSRWARLEKETA